jgi:toxin-antitoxin system PIN domain toxin
MSARYLYDVNVLIARSWPLHVHHDLVLTWVNVQSKCQWATCDFTQAGFLRIMTQPNFVKGTGHSPIEMHQAIALLQNNLASTKHHYLHLNLGFDKVLSICSGGLRGHKQVTDAYLLSLAVVNNYKLVTLDKGLPSLLATQAERDKHILVLE